MPSPVAHGSLVLVVSALVGRHDRLRQAVADAPAFFYLAALAALWAPDVDFLLRLLIDDPALRHGGATHSLAIGVAVGVVFTGACRARYGAAFPTTLGFGIGAACAWAHALMDMATWGSGVMLLWPFSVDRYRTVPLFFGARHSQPGAWELHLVTLLTELLFIAALWWVVRHFVIRHKHPQSTAVRSR